MGVSKVNKLKDLIHELCPNGVEYKKLGDCCVLEKGSTPIQKAIPGEFPLVVTTEERKSCNTYQFDKPTVCIPLVSSRGHGVASLNRLYYQEGKFALGNILCGVTPINSDELSAKFLFYYLNHKKDTLIVPLMRGGANVSLTVDSLKKVKVPIPPIPVQNEIVHIFSKFESLGLALTSELTLRKQQYEWFRNKLFSGEEFEYLPIKEIATTNIGLATSVTKHKSESGVLLLHNSDIQQNRIVLKQHEYITEEFAKKNAKKILRKDDIITVHTGDVGTSAVIDRKYIGSIGFTTITTRIKDKKKVMPQYLCHYLNSQRCKTDIAAMTISDRSNLNQSSFENIVVPIPGVEVQKYIISALESFDAFCNDFCAGLPAEIQARHKQYEYYRDKLLTFKPLL